MPLVTSGNPTRALQLKRPADDLGPLLAYLDIEHRYRFVNRAYGRFHGHPTSWFIGRHVRDVLGEEAYEHRKPVVAEVLAGREVEFESPLPPDGIGPQGILHTQCVPDFDEGGTVRGVLVICRDAALERRAEEARRLASFRTFVGGFAHELNNPLAYLMANLETIEREHLRDGGSALPHAELAQLLKETRDGAQRMRRIVQGLTLSGGEPVGLAKGSGPVVARPFDVRDALEQACTRASDLIRHRARLVKDLGELPPVAGDESMLAQALLNLITNGAQAMPEGRANENELRVVTKTDAAGSAVIEVRDTGRGIPKEILDHIFVPFFTTRDVGEGTGLGLSIARGIILSMGGQVEVETEVGTGTVFRVILPAAPATAQASTSDRGVSDTAPARRGQVLIVDDDEYVAKVLVRSLRKDHDVTLATNGKQALDLLLAGGRFDIIVCDMMMPVMTGMALYAELESRVPEAISRLVFVTGGASTPATKAFLATVSNELLYKPFDLGRLQAIVRKYADRTG